MQEQGQRRACVPPFDAGAETAKAPPRHGPERRPGACPVSAGWPEWTGCAAGRRSPLTDSIQPAFPEKRRGQKRESVNGRPAGRVDCIHGFGNATFQNASVTDDSGWKPGEGDAQFDLAAVLKSAIGVELGVEGIAGDGCRIKTSILKCEPGNAFKRWLMPGYGAAKLYTESRVATGTTSRRPRSQSRAASAWEASFPSAHGRRPSRTLPESWSGRSRKACRSRKTPEQAGRRKAWPAEPARKPASSPVTEPSFVFASRALGPVQELAPSPRLWAAGPAGLPAA